MSSHEMLIVIGAGQAGAELAVRAREAGWAGAISLVGDEPPLPYHRPPLSKAYLAGEVDIDQLALKARSTYAKAGIELMLGRRIVHVDRGAALVRFAGGGTMRYAKLALATGGRARRLPAQASLADTTANLHSLRTPADADRIRARFAPGMRLVIVGAGFVGLEVASIAVRFGLKVVVLEAGPRVLARVMGAPVSGFVAGVHRDAGVDVRTATAVERFETDAAGRLVTAVVCTNGERIAADLVVVGIGLVPNTELAARASLPIDDGIVIDACCRTIDPAIVAAGDCTRQHSALYGRALRLESVPNAVEQARAAAASVVGKTRPNAGVPWFWSDQYDLKLKTAGIADGHERIVLRGSPSTRSFSAFYLQGERVLAADTINRPAEFMLAKRLVAERLRVSDQRLADDSIPLDTLWADD